MFVDIEEFWKGEVKMMEKSVYKVMCEVV